MSSRRESMLEALKDLITAALPAAQIQRNSAWPERVAEGGMVVIEDGDPGDPETTLSPVRYSYEHAVPLIVFAADGEALDLMLIAIGSAIEADRTLGGLTDWLEPSAPSADDVATRGGPTLRAAGLHVLAAYTTPNPLH